MFNKEEFRDFVENQIIWLGRDRRCLTKELVLDAICQFNISSYKYLNLTKDSYSRQIRKIFDVSEKPHSVSINIWLLHGFGFKRCAICNSILSINSFNACNRAWDKKLNECRVCRSKVRKQYRVDNIEKEKEYKDQYRTNNRNQIKISNREYRQNNKDKINAKTNMRRATKLNATPKWVNSIEIKDIYWCSTEIEKLLGQKQNVDHIYSLLGKEICGLHIAENLRIIPEKENLSKGNKLPKENTLNFQEWLESL